MTVENISERSRRIARNTVLLYFRMLLLMGVGLVTSRVVLRSLGTDDFGIYSAVAGFVALFTVLTASLSTAISRFLTFELGRGDTERLRKIFGTAVCIQLLLFLLIAVLADPAGLWWISHKMVLAPERIPAARLVLQLSLLSLGIQLVSVPYNAAIIAHERMGAFAWISLFEGCGKLAVAYAIAVSDGDRLVLYAALLAAVSFVTRLLYGLFCRRHFPEAHYRLSLDRPLFREMFAFAGWNFIGSGSGILRDQGGNQLLNLFFGTAANAAWGLAAQVSGAVQKFVTSFTTALNPQITKSYAAGERDYMFRLVFRGSRISVWLLLLVVLPVEFNAPFLVDLWLTEVPAGTVLFIRLVLIYLTVEAVSYTMVTAMLATGKIRDYQLLVGGLQLLNLPMDYLLLRAGAPAHCIWVVAIAIAVLCLCARLYMLRRMIGLPVGRFLRDVLGREVVVAAAAAAVPWLLLGALPLGCWWGFLVHAGATVLWTAAVIFALGLDADERRQILRRR